MTPSCAIVINGCLTADVIHILHTGNKTGCSPLGVVIMLNNGSHVPPQWRYY